MKMRPKYRAIEISGSTQTETKLRNACLDAICHFLKLRPSFQVHPVYPFKIYRKQLVYIPAIKKYHRFEIILIQHCFTNAINMSNGIFVLFT